MEASEMEYANKLNQVRDIFEEYKILSAQDLVNFKVFKAIIDAKVFLDQNKHFFGVIRSVNYIKKEV